MFSQICKLFVQLLHHKYFFKCVFVFVCTLSQSLMFIKVYIDLETSKSYLLVSFTRIVRLFKICQYIFYKNVKDLGNSAGRMQLLDASKACGGIKVEVNPIDSESAQLPLEEGENSSSEGLDTHIKTGLEQNDIKTVQNVGDTITPSTNSLPLESISAVIAGIMIYL